jgi:hypothetical protein
MADGLYILLALRLGFYLIFDMITIIELSQKVTMA